MDERKSIFLSVFDLVSGFGTAYCDTVSKIFNVVFKKPLFFLFRTLKRIVRLLLRSIILFFSPADSGKEFTDDVIRALKKCFITLFTHPFSFIPLLKYYIKKAKGRYSFSAKNILMWLIPTVFIAAFAVAAYSISSFVPALRIETGGETIGYVETEERFFAAKSRVRDILSASEEEISFPDIKYSFTYVKKNSLTDERTLCDRILAETDTDMINACGVYIDGAPVGVLADEIEARKVFDGFLHSARGDESNYTVSFAQDIEYKMGLYPESSVMTVKEFTENLVLGSKREFLYTVKSGDTVKSIASLYSLTEERIKEMNPDTDFTEELAEGKILRLEKYDLPLTLKEIKSEVQVKPVQYDKIEIESNALYAGSTRVLASGKPGYSQVTSLVTYVGGVKVSTDEVMSVVISEPVPERIQVGTKPLDEAYTNMSGDAMFIWPIVGAYGINSDYGYRWGKLHGGIDLGMGNAAGTSLGKNIVAVAPGTVVTASVHSSYGYYVIIDHGGGMQTLYAHCYANSFMVVPGQTVVAGQPIARVGSTGYSTGPHLHFEVRINGNRVDPKPYLGIKY